jgi:nitric oxide reductase NorQ protein
VVEARKDTTVVLHPLTDDRRIPAHRAHRRDAGRRQPVHAGGVVQPGLPERMLKGLKPSPRASALWRWSLNYPSPEIERSIVQTESGATDNVANRLVRLAASLRCLTDHDLEETASTRLLVAAGRLAASGLPLALACRAAIIDALTDDADTATALHEVVRAVIGDEN